MRLTIRTRGGPVMFWAPDSGGYVRTEHGTQHGTLGQQICRGGGYRGDTLRCGGTAASLASVARRWLAQRRRADARYGVQS